jgi:hypothetical protein
MSKLFWLWLLLSLLLFPRMATAQNFGQAPSPVVPPSPKQSHHPLPLTLDLASAQETLPQRLQELHELYERHQLKDQVQELLKDSRFRNYMEKLSESDWRRLQEKILAGEGLSQDPSWVRLFQQMASQQRLDQRQIDLLRRLAKRIEPQVPAPSEYFLPNGPGSVAPPPRTNAPGLSVPPSVPMPTELRPSLFDQLQEEATKWLMGELDDLGADMLQALTEMGGNEENTPLAEMLRSVPPPDLWHSYAPQGNERFVPFIPALRSGTLARYLADAGDFLHRQRGLWDRASSLFHRASQPSPLPFPGSSISVPASSSADGDGWAPALLSLLMFGALVLLLCKGGLGLKSPGSGADVSWRPGPWPVPPNAVSTRQDLIRAFEYLALLRLGPAAAACHHRQLAERLAEEDSNNPGRRQAAEMLAWLYEQARYAPDSEALSAEQLSDARHALCFLAGVTAA